ncbi:MAG: UbiH/UbiF/VisC/COQ6 family ubiquinone biosynthesis hydroxylase [Pseudomonadota bacterium]|nr:UbiH/UbiF/VisC/COQ6 family ubiquinone biosynthesis hydroxylase [Pseudomonadota bacterium]
MADHSDILIVGGGLNGPALALALAQAGFSVSVIDAMARDTRDDPGFDGRAYALALTSCRMLDAIGLWSDLRAHAEPMLKIAVSDGHAGAGPSPFAMQFDHAEIEEGPMGHVVEDRFLRRALMAAMDAAHGVTQINGAQVVAQDITPSGATVTLADGRQLSGRVLVGADGRNSGTATRAGIRRTAWGYGQTALVCAVSHEAPHDGTAHQFFMPSGPLAILPLPGDVSSIVWSEETDRAKALMQAGDDAFLEALRPRFGDFLGEISLAGQRFSYPLGLSLAQRLVAPRVALVGDAAHGLHPIAGQGLNAGFRDIAALAEVLAEAKRRGEDIGTALVLDRYAQWRRFDTAALAMATDTFNRLFSNDNPLLRLGRDIGMGVVNAAPGLRRGFIREAAGLTGDLPRLMQGQAA